MHAVRMVGDFFELGPESGAEYLKIFLRALVESNMLYLRNHPDTPDLYTFGRAGTVRYQRELPFYDEHLSKQVQPEEWQIIPEIIATGEGDCEDLASWRVAELRVKYRRNDVQVFRRRRELPNGIQLFHILVRYQDGRLEDPSRILGMR